LRLSKPSYPDVLPCLLQGWILWLSSEIWLFSCSAWGWDSSRVDEQFALCSDLWSLFITFHNGTQWV
jgi:hypothetical protein